MAQRIRGQEVEVWFVSDVGGTLALKDIRSFSFTPKFTKLEEQYLGETSKRYDELYDGADFDLELHVEDTGVLDFMSLIRARAADRTSKTFVNINAKFKFASGSLKNIVLKDCFFENMPINVGSRSDYVTFKVSGSCTDYDVF